MSQTIYQFGNKGLRLRAEHRRGLRISQLLTGAWRDLGLTANRAADVERFPDAPSTTDFWEAELTEILPLLSESGAGALGWWRLRHTALANSVAGQTLHDIYRRFRLSALIHEREIAYVLALLRAEGIEPVLIKGWASARLYPEPGLRPYGDIDLCIRPDQFAQAGKALQPLVEVNGHYVDLHCGFTRIGQTKGSLRQRRSAQDQQAMRVWDELFSRSQLVPLHSASLDAKATGFQEESGLKPSSSRVAAEPAAAGNVRILSDEDHMRLLSTHLLRSGARRPPWLCDIALLLEARAKDFDWKICLRQTSNRSLNWLATSLGLAGQLLGADISGIKNTELGERVRNLPRWLAPAVLSQWGATRFQSLSPKVRDHGSTREGWKLNAAPWTSLANLYARGDNPVRATAAVGGQFNNWPRFPYRLAELLLRIPEAPEQFRLLRDEFAFHRRVGAITSAHDRWDTALRPG